MGELHGAPLSSLEPASSIPQRSTEKPMSTLTIIAPVARGPTSQVAREAIGLLTIGRREDYVGTVLGPSTSRTSIVEDCVKSFILCLRRPCLT